MKKFVFLWLLIMCFDAGAADTKPFGFVPKYIEGSSRSKFDSDGVLNVVFPAQKFRPQESGFNFSALLPPADEKIISYEVKIPDGFSFVKGGKLPGLCGGVEATGGRKATGTNGFSVRPMWRRGGKLVSYVYHVDQKTRYGDDFGWEVAATNLTLSSAKWHQVEINVRLNTPGEKNGTVGVKFDGVTVFSKEDFNFRLTNAFQIDRLCFNTFFGGNDKSWAPSTDQTMQIRNLVVR